MMKGTHVLRYVPRFAQRTSASNMAPERFVQLRNSFIQRVFLADKETSAILCIRRRKPPHLSSCLEYPVG